MPGFDWSNDNLISSIKRRAAMPTSQATFQNSDFLALADEELQTVIFPMMMSIKGDYFIANNDTVMTSETNYPIPSDAVGLKIKDLYWMNPNDDQLREIEIPQVSITDVTNSWAAGWAGVCFYLQTNSVVLTPRSLPQQTLRMKYYKRANKMVTNEEACTISAINTVTLQVTVDAVPTDFAVGSLLNCIDETPGFLTLASNLEITNIAGTVLTLDSVDDLSVGDWLALEGESPVAQICPEAIPILAQSVAVKCLEAQGDPGLVIAQEKFNQIRDNFLKTMTPRVDAQAPKITNRTGTLGAAKYGWWGFWGNG